jgi:ankyrin repeat protein
VGDCLETIKYLVSQGADITARNNQAVIGASFKGHLETVKYLVSQGADVTARYNEAVFHASDSGHLETVKNLVSQGADVTERDIIALDFLKCLYIKDYLMQ